MAKQLIMKKFTVVLLIFFAGALAGLQAQKTYNTDYDTGDKLVLKGSLQGGRMAYAGHSSPDYPGFGMAGAVDFSLGLQADGSKLWHSIYGYPEYSLSFWYSYLGNKDIYGFMRGIAPDMTFTLHEKGDNRLRMRLGLGFAYFNKPHDFDSNRMNVVIGSNITNLSVASLVWEHSLSNYFNFQGGLHFIHCSNGHYTLPNLGLNLPLLFAGISYKPGGQVSHYLPPDGIPEPPENGKFHVRAGYGSHEFGRSTTITADKKYEVYTATITYSKFFWKGGRYHVGFSAKYYEDWEEKIRETDFYQKNLRLKSSAFTFILGHEFFFNHLSLYTHGGLNLYNPFFEKFTKINYTEMNWHSYIKKFLSGKLGVQYYLKAPYTHSGVNAYTGIFIKSNFTQADFAEVAVGFIF